MQTGVANTWTCPEMMSIVFQRPANKAPSTLWMDQHQANEAQTILRPVFRRVTSAHKTSTRLCRWRKLNVHAETCDERESVKTSLQRHPITVSSRRLRLSTLFPFLLVLPLESRDICMFTVSVTSYWWGVDNANAKGHYFQLKYVL